MKPVFYAFLTALAGVGIFHLLDLPLPWLMGPIIACLIAALAGVPMRGVASLNAGMRTILGVAVGATLTPAVLATFPAMWPTLLMVPLMVVCIGVSGIPYFRRVWGYDAPTSYYAAMPGGLQDMILFGEEAGANVRSMSLIQATRVLVIVVALPFLMKGIWEALLMVVCAIAGWWAAKAVGLFGASILGPMIVAAIVTLAGFLEHRPPAEAIWAAQFFIGLSIGSRYTGITGHEVRRDLVAGLGFCVILMILTVAFVEVILLLDLAPGMEALLAFAPGGQAEMTVLALVVGADVAFVVSHHVLRLVIVILGAPLVAGVVRPKPRD
jgi:membrane AbrB-like protein